MWATVSMGHINDFDTEHLWNMEASMITKKCVFWLVQLKILNTYIKCQKLVLHVLQYLQIYYLETVKDHSEWVRHCSSIVVYNTEQSDLQESAAKLFFL